VRALFDAAMERKLAGGDPHIEVMIPLAVNEPELALAISWVREVADETASATYGAAGINYAVGTMVETPRAALVADEIARVAEFFSFGTNDLTQMTFGFSRDDVEGRFLPRYLELGLLPANPFETLDVDGVGQLVELAVQKGRATRPDLKLGICGEHGGDPKSVAFCHHVGLDYVSCSPYRVPLARLAAAHAALESSGPGATA
jgi:pyruvate,orthophosphate dikinase